MIELKYFKEQTNLANVFNSYDIFGFAEKVLACGPETKGYSRDIAHILKVKNEEPSGKVNLKKKGIRRGKVACVLGRTTGLEGLFRPLMQ